MTPSNVWLVAITLVAVPPCAAGAAEFELKDGDRVVWLGSTLIESEQRYGYWETALTARYPDRNITFRNLAWSGDNVWGESRVAFDLNKPGIGLKRMVDLTLAEKPTVIFICYGTVESFEGEAGLDRFEKQYAKLLEELKPAKARVVLISPISFQKSRSLPDPSPRNKDLALYRDVIKKLAQARELRFVDLFEKARVEVVPVTENGMHLTEEGYQHLTPLVEYAFGWEKATTLSGPTAEKLRKTIVEKNELYFHRWRPQNETYLFGFRKHEQGKNAREVVEFDPLIAAKEKEIARLRSELAASRK